METSQVTPTFEQLGIIPPIVKALLEIGYETPTAIQLGAIPALLSGRDLLGQAQTGTGKTGAFALPLLCKLDLNKRAPQILVLTPTRELALQVAEAFQTYARKLSSFHVLPVYGGQSMSTQLHQLKRGPHVVVGTPGRIMDHLRRKSLDLSTLQAVVLDEADEMLNMGFAEDIEWILEHTPTEKQIALFSATMPAPIRKVAGKYLKNQQEIKIHTKTSTVETIGQYFWPISGVQKLDALTRILEVEEFDAALIFVRTKTATMELAEKLEARGHSCAALNGDLSQELRERTINALKKGDLDIIVATDVAARGLDVERITHVINFDIPHDPEAYVHRIGRTGRAGRQGKAILFVSPRERRLLAAIERTTRHKIEQFRLPTKHEVSEKRIQRFKDQISETIKSNDLSYFEPIIEQLATEHETGDRQVAAALCFLLQQESPFILEEAGNAYEGSRDRDSGRDFRDRDSRGRDSRDRDPRDRDSRDRDPRDSGDRRQRDFGGPRERRDDSHMVTYRIEVGKMHDVTPSNIVGAIANSSDIQGRQIGRIELHDDYSTVDLPGVLPPDLLSYLQNVHVRDRKMLIRPVGGENGAMLEKIKSRKAYGKTDREKPTRERPNRTKFGKDKKDSAAPWQKSKPTRSRPDKADKGDKAGKGKH